MKLLTGLRLSLKLSLTALLIFIFSFSDLANQNAPFSQWFVLNNLPFTQEYHVTVGWRYQDTNFIITAGGRINGNTSNNVLLYNTTTGQYRPLPPMPVQLEKAGGFILKDSMYIVGGSTNSGNNFSNALIKIDLSNPVSWVNRANYPMPIGEISYSTSERNDSLAYVAGGRNNANPVNNVFLYNGKANVWIPANNLPTQGIFGGGLAFLQENMVMFIGGKSNDSAHSLCFFGNINPGNPANINWNGGPIYPGGKICNLGNWGAKDGRAFFTGGESIFPMDNSSTDKTYMYEMGVGFNTLADKPTPISHVPIDGFIIDTTSSGYEYEIFAPGGFDGSAATNKHEKLFVLDSLPTYIGQVGNVIPDGFELHQNYPNPFNPQTKIRFDIPVGSLVQMNIYNSEGKLVRMLLNNVLKTGAYEVKMNSEGLPSGIYFYTMTADNWKSVRKMVLIK
jgi:hypothetical protein